MAWALGSALKAAAEKRHVAVAIDIQVNGHALFSYAMPGLMLDNWEWIRRKRNVVMRYRRSSYAIGLKHQRAGTTGEGGGLDGRRFTPSICFCFPILLEGTGCVGTVTVSLTLPQREDHALVVSVLQEYLHFYGARDLNIWTLRDRDQGTHAQKRRYGGTPFFERGADGTQRSALSRSCRTMATGIWAIITGNAGIVIASAKGIRSCLPAGKGLSSSIFFVTLAIVRERAALGCLEKFGFMASSMKNPFLVEFGAMQLSEDAVFQDTSAAQCCQTRNKKDQRPEGRRKRRSLQGQWWVA